jgi:DNA-nicking Smr family endonuclease
VKPPRGLSAEEAAAWAQVAATVERFHPAGSAERDDMTSVAADPSPAPAKPRKPPAPLNPPAPARSPRTVEDKQHLDSTWDRKLARGALRPDLTLDLHGHTLDTAYARLVDGLDQARAMGARVVLLIAGKQRPAAAADRAGQRGAIRAKVLDWLAASRHHAAIAAVRKAHIRHGGEGALYIVLKRAR